MLTLKSDDLITLAVPSSEPVSINVLSALNFIAVIASLWAEGPDEEKHIHIYILNIKLV